MPTKVTAANTWSIVNQRAHCRGQNDFVQEAPAIDLAVPQEGIALLLRHDRVVRHDHIHDHLLGIDVPADCRLGDHWTRGSDVTAVYEPKDVQRLRATAMWRLHPELRAMEPHHEVVAWEVVASAQTSALKSDSSLAVVSTLAANTILWGELLGESFQLSGHASPTANCILVRRDAGTSCLVAVHPTDLRRIEITHRSGRVAIGCWLFSSTVEKGVLLRSRVLAAIGPATNDLAWATSVALAFAASTPPLTS